MTDSTSPTLTSFKKLTMERERLLSSTSRYKQALESQVADLKQGATRLLVQGLVFGGVAIGTYLLVRAFQKKGPAAPATGNSENLPASTRFTTALFASIQSYIISFLLSIAREKITEYLEAYLAKNHDTASKNQA